MTYTLPQWLLFFFIYCFLGWCIESAIVSVDTKKLTNRGFLHGPALPIYGFGAITILLCTLPFDGSILMQYIAGVIACTALEYVTGVLMEAIFKTKYWDYSDKFMNFQGRICLVSSLFWGVLTLFVVHVIHEPIADFVLNRMNYALVITLDVCLGALMLADLYFSAKAAFMLNKIAEALDEINLQLELAKMEARDKLQLKAAEINLRIEDANDRFRDMGDDFARRISDLRSRRDEALNKAGFWVRSMVKGNPTAHSKKFAKGYSELKEYIGNKINSIKK